MGVLYVWGKYAKINEGIVSTLAGSASSAWVDGVGTAARFINTLPITVSNNGDIYVGDKYAIRIVTSSGQCQSPNHIIESS